MSGENLHYFNRRAAQERAAADAASSQVAANIHRMLAERFSELAANEACMVEPEMELPRG